jgi:GcrA cell cycle regulator
MPDVPVVFDWHDAALTRLRALWDEGHSTAEIGRRLGVSKNAVVGKAHRLDLPARPSPIRRDKEPGWVRPPARPRPIRLPPLPSLAVPLPDIAAAPEGTPTPARKRATRPCIMPIGTRVTPCCWPIGTPGTSGFRICGDDSVAGRPYCSGHCSMAYVRTRDRREDAA